MNEIDNLTPVIVLNSGHHGALGVVRSLGRLGVPVHLLDANPRAPAFSSEYCQGSFVWDIEQASSVDSIEYLGKIARGLGRPTILIPTSDAGALFLAANTAVLRKWFRFPSLSLDLVQCVINKKRMHVLARSVGMHTPDAFFPESKQDVRIFAQDAIFPFILKTIEGRPRNNEPHTNQIARNEKELLDAYELMEEPGCPNLMIQEYIPEGKDASWMFNGYFDADSECLFGLSGMKIRQNPPEAGMTSLGACLPNATVAETTMKFMKTIRFCGIGHRLQI